MLFWQYSLDSFQACLLSQYLASLSVSPRNSPTISPVPSFSDLSSLLHHSNHPAAPLALSVSPTFNFLSRIRTLPNVHSNPLLTALAASPAPAPVGLESAVNFYMERWQYRYEIRVQGGCYGEEKAINRWDVTLDGIPHFIIFEHGLGIIGGHKRRILVDGEVVHQSEIPALFLTPATHSPSVCKLSGVRLSSSPLLWKCITLMGHPRILITNLSLITFPSMYGRPWLNVLSKYDHLLSILLPQLTTVPRTK